LGSWGVAHRELMPDAIHDTSRYAAIGPSFPFSRRECEGGVCVDSSRHTRASASWVFMRLSTICSTWADICSWPSTIESSDSLPLRFGNTQQKLDEYGLPGFAQPWQSICQYPPRTLEVRDDCPTLYLRERTFRVTRGKSRSVSSRGSVVLGKGD
jgi:hypothetical protein